MFNLNSKVALVTGAGSRDGIGFATARILMQAGSKVFITSTSDRIFDRVQELKDQFGANFIEGYVADLTVKSEVDQVISEVTKKFKKIDILVNNAGEIETSAFLMTKIDTFKKIFQVNFYSPVLLMQMVLKNMIKNKSGSIINLSSISAFESNEGRSAYSASKSALNSISKTIARELGKVNIRVNNVAPGIIDTKMLNSNTNKEIIKELINKSSLKRVGNPEEVASTILFLASDMSSYISGETIKVDGGM